MRLDLPGQPYAGSQQPYVSQQATIFVRGICISKPLASLQAYAGTGQYSAAGQQAMLDPDDVPMKSVSVKRSLVCMSLARPRTQQGRNLRLCF